MAAEEKGAAKVLTKEEEAQALLVRTIRGKPVHFLPDRVHGAWGGWGWVEWEVVEG
jgi:hypothetical protein